MRKIPDDAELLRLSDNGMTGTELAELYGCSRAAISKRLIRLRQQTPPESFAKLPPDRQQFALLVAQGHTKADAAAEAFDGVTTAGSARVVGSRIAREPDVDLAIQDLLAQEGLTRRYRVNKLKKMIDSPDLSIVGRGLELSWKLEGAFQDRAQVEIVGIEQLRQLIDLIPDNKPVIEAEYSVSRNLN